MYPSSRFLISGVSDASYISGWVKVGKKSSKAAVSSMFGVRILAEILLCFFVIFLVCLGGLVWIRERLLWLV